MIDPYKRLTKDPYKTHIDKLVRPIFEKVPQEIKVNTMSVARPIQFFWRPNNYRLQFNFKIETFKRNTTLKSGVQISNFGTKYTYHNFYNTTVILDIPKRKKSPKITLIYKPSKRFYYEIKCSNLAEIDKKINEKVLNIEQSLMEALKLFISNYGGSVDMRTKKWVRFEDDIHGEDYIDNIPRDMVITDTYFKKVYQKGLEFKNPAYVKAYISNRAIEEIAPEIAAAINGLGMEFSNFSSQALPVIQELALNMGTHIKVLKGIEKGIDKFNKTVETLNKRLEQKKLSEYL